MYHPALQALNVVTTMVQQQTHFKVFVAAANGVFIGVRLCACLCAILIIILTIASPTASDFQKHPCGTLTSQPQRYNKQQIRSYPNTLIYISYVRRNTCVAPFKLATPRGSHVNHIPKGLLILTFILTAGANQPHANPHYFLFMVHLSAAVSNYHSSCQRRGSHGTTAALQDFPFVTATNGSSTCGFMSVRMFVCHCRTLQQNDPGTQSQEQSYHSAFFALLRFCYDAVCCCCALVSQLKLLTLWQPRYSSSSRTSRSSLVTASVYVCTDYVGVPSSAQRGTTLFQTHTSFEIRKHPRNATAIPNSSSSGTTPMNLPTPTYIQ